MSKIRLTENQLHRVIKESVKKILTELDWKTYQNAAKKAHLKAYDDYDKEDPNFEKYRNKSSKFSDSATDSFMRDHGYDDGRYYMEMNNAMYGSPKSIRPYYDASNIKMYDRDEEEENPPFYEDPSYFEDMPNNVRQKYNNAYNELSNYKLGNYDYKKGKGWKLKSNK